MSLLYVYVCVYIYERFLLLIRKLTKRTDISDDQVHEDVKRLANEGLLFLKQRDIFWDQLQQTTK